MAQKRVHEFAKELGVDNKILVNMLTAVGVNVKNHMSIVTKEQIDLAVAKKDGKKTDPHHKHAAGSQTSSDDKKIVRIRRDKDSPLTAGKEHEAASAPKIKPTLKIRKVEKKEEEPKEEPTTQIKVLEETKDFQLTQSRTIGGILRRRKQAPIIEEPTKEEPLKEEMVAAQESNVSLAKPKKIPTKFLIEVAKQRAPEKKKKEKEEKKLSPSSGLAALQEAFSKDKSIKPKVSISIEYAKEEPSPPTATEPRLNADGTYEELAPEKIIESRFDIKKKVFSFKKEDSSAIRGHGHGKVYIPPKRRKKRPSQKMIRTTQITTPKASKRVVKISNTISVGDLAKAMSIKAGEIIKKLMAQGMLVTITHILDADTATLMANEFGYEVENVAFEESQIFDNQVTQEKSIGTTPRPPVVTVMGHVDHGKTSILDAIRKANVAAHEAGGITQHIGAYTVSTPKGTITFIDTPGHEAFTSMRSRGAQLTDIVILVVACDDGVMPQTVEAINHAKAAKVPIIVAINKIDLPQAKSDMIKAKLAEFSLSPEEWGGETLFVETSAKTKKGIPELLDTIMLQAEMMELKSNPNKKAQGVIIETKLEKGRGPVATVLVKDGTLKIGDYFVSGTQYGKIRALINDKGQRVDSAGPSIPVEILGLPGLPEAGDTLLILDEEKDARTIADHRKGKARELELAKSTKISLEELYTQIESGVAKDLRVVIKADTHGSAEALKASLNKISTQKIRVEILHSGVGGISESDVLLAAASNAIIMGFNVRPDVNASLLAKKEGVNIRITDIIYDTISDVKQAMEGLLDPEKKEEPLGKAKVLNVFTVSKVGTIAGVSITQGKVERAAKVRLIRDNIVIHEGAIKSLKRFKDDVKEVTEGYECGIMLDNYNDVQVNDLMEIYKIVEYKATL